MGKKSFSRTEAEAKEGLESVKNDVPENRMQSEQQIQNTEEALVTKPKDQGYGLKDSKMKGSKLKQEAIAEVISGGSDSGMGIGAGGRSVSGTGAGILTADNSTPFADKVRSKTRVGKKLDRLANKLNYTPSEQVLVEFDESKPLAEARDADQGYNGTYRNEFARSQKHSGGVPGDLLFQRSVDLILKDQLYYSQGQIVLPANTEAAKLAYTPNKTYAGLGKMKDYKVHVGDYLVRRMHLKLDNNGQVRHLFFDVDDVTAAESNPDLANKASAFRLIHSNKAELDRINMDAKAGDEKADIWTPLARAVYQPSKTAYLLSAIEAETGNYMYLAYAKATTNFSYQLNRAPKDGQDIVGPAVEQLLGLTREGSTSTDYTNYRASVRACLNKNDYAAGAASLMIELYDSPAKYNNKADLLLQPRGFRMHLQTADNNINAFRVDENFVNVYAGNECFSTIDHEYDPLMPICMTDKAGLIDRLNINELGAFCIAEHNIVYSSTNIEENFGEDDSQTELVELIPEGFTRDTAYIISNQGSLLYYNNGVIGMKKDGNNRENVAINLLATYDGTHLPTGYTIVCTVAAGSGVSFQNLKVRDGGLNHDRITAWTFETEYENKFYLKDCGPYTYAYDDLRNNYVVEVKHPIIEGLTKYFEESIGAKLYTLVDRGEVVVPWVFSTQYASLAAYILCAAAPWIQQARLNSMRDIFYYEDNVHEYPFSGLIAIKDAPFKNYVNFNYNGYDEPLETKVMQPTQAIRWIMPEFFWHLDSSSYDYVAPWYVNQAEFDPDNTEADPQNAAMSMPSIRSGIRFNVLDLFYGMSEKDVRLSLDRLTTSLFNSEKIQVKGVYKYGHTTDGQVLLRFVNSGNVFTIQDVLSAPREIGLLAEVPGYVLTPNGTSGVAGITDGGMGTSYRIKVWTNSSVTCPESEILADMAVDIKRGANYTQKWFQLDANTGTSNEQILGMVFGLNDEGSAQFSPFVGMDETAFDTAPVVVSHQRSLWTRLQMLPFALSPFDAEPTANSINMDIYDMLYVFGLAGFRASDYRESVYNRSKEVVNQGLLFVNDPWVQDSPILIHGAKSTGVVISKGYELGK